MKIRAYKTTDQASVVALWKAAGLVAKQNNPVRDIDRKLKVNPELFLVGVVDEVIVGSVMGGYEGHRGWVNYLAVSPSMQRRGYAEKLMHTIEDLLREKGCPKINLQVRDANQDALKFYASIGYVADNVIGLGKRLEND